MPVVSLSLSLSSISLIVDFQEKPGSFYSTHPHQVVENSSKIPFRSQFFQPPFLHHVLQPLTITSWIPISCWGFFGAMACWKMQHSRKTLTVEVTNLLLLFLSQALHHPSVCSRLCDVFILSPEAVCSLHSTMPKPILLPNGKTVKDHVTNRSGRVCKINEVG